MRENRRACWCARPCCWAPFSHSSSSDFPSPRDISSGAPAAAHDPAASRRGALMPLFQRITSISLWALAQILFPIVLIAAFTVWAAFHFVQSAPPRTITISTGPSGSFFDTMAARYAKILARSGITLKLVQSAGSIENLARLSDHKSKVDIALVQ